MEAIFQTEIDGTPVTPGAAGAISAGITAGDPVGGAPHIPVVEIRASERQVLVGGKRANLTMREFELFGVLAGCPDRVLTRDQIFDRVWGGRMTPRDRSVDVHVRKIRRKLAAISSDITYIHTHFGIGYRYAAEPDDS